MSNTMTQEPSAAVTTRRVDPGGTLAVAAAGSQAVTSVPADGAAMGSGANNTARYVGSAIGITIVAVMVNRAGAPGAVGVVSGWNIAALITAGFSLLGALAVLLASEELYAVE